MRFAFTTKIVLFLLQKNRILRWGGPIKSNGPIQWANAKDSFTIADCWLVERCNATLDIFFTTSSTQRF